MQPINENEIPDICASLERCLDSQLQNAFVFKTGFVLELSKKSNSNYLVIDLNPRAPYVCYVERECPVSFLKDKKPLTLFLKAHAKGKRVSKINHIQKLGRVIQLQLGYEEPVSLEIRLFPHGQNILATFGDKKISVFPPKEVTRSSSVEKKEFPQRTVYKINTEWLKGFEKKPGPQFSKEAFLEKKKIAIEKIETLLNELKAQKWEEVGLLLKSLQTLRVPTDLKKYVDPKISFSKNLEHVFSKAKEIKQKMLGANERLLLLQTELQSMQSQDEEVLKNLLIKPQKQKKNQKKSSARFYDISEKCQLFIGKNAVENLKLLRDSQSWDYWLHLKDYPGAHGILRCPRNYILKPQEIEVAAQWVAERSKKSHHQIQEGESFEVIVTQKRFVKPIKGDKLGRVRYSDESIYAYKKRSTP